MDSSGEYKMKYLVILFFSTMAAASTSMNDSGEFWGYRMTNRKLLQSIIREGEDFELYRYLGSSKLADLLGFFPSNEVDGKFRNGKPSAANVMLWGLMMENFSKAIGDTCYGQGVSHSFRDQFVTDLLTLCKWPSMEAKDPALWDRLWFSLMFYDAPPEELEAWKQLFLTGDFDSASANEVLSSAVFTVFLNPYYLLRN
jgi:hypothetical protein